MSDDGLSFVCLFVKMCYVLLFILVMLLVVSDDEMFMKLRFFFSFVSRVESSSFRATFDCFECVVILG